VQTPELIMQQTMIQLSLSELYTVMGIMGVVGGALFTVLTLFISNKLSNLEKQIIQGIELKFVSKEVVTLQMSEMSRRVSRLEAGSMADSGVRKRKEDE